MKPKISIIMGLYNCQATLKEAIDSIIAQTYTDWELIMCDDGSKDHTYKLAQEYKDQLGDKVILLKNEKNLGLNSTLNKCIDYARGEYIARMDGDDISLPQRFQVQMEFLEKNPNYDLVGVLAQHFDEDGEWGAYYLPKEPTPAAFLKNSPFVHATIIMKTQVLKELGGYTVSKKLLRVEDYHLWVRMYAAGYKGYNLQEFLYMFRDDRNAYGRRKYRFRVNEFRVRWLVATSFPLGIKAYLCAFRPLIVGALPMWLYDVLHKKNIQTSGKGKN